MAFLVTLRQALDVLRDPDVVTDGERRASTLVVVIATLAFACAASWGVAAPILAGHEASMASMGIIADNMLRWGIAAPVWLPSAVPPEPAAYYCHHPFGIFWTTTGFVALFGASDTMCRLPAVLCSVATVPVVFLLGKELHRPLAGAAAAVAFVSLPISVAFANFNALEVPLMLWSAVTLLGYVRFRRSRLRKHLVLCVVGAVLAVNTDWPAFVLVLALVLIELGALPGVRRVRPRDLACSAWLLGGTGVVALGYLVAFHHFGKLDDLFGSASARAGDGRRTLGQVLDTRAYWIELMFTPLGVALGKVGALLLLVRAFVRRAPEELAGVAVLAMCLAQYLLFRQGADVHVFWPHPFALFFALAVAAFSATLVTALTRFRSLAARPWLLSLGLVGALLAPIARDAVPVLVWARRSGGRFNEKGAFIESDAEKLLAVRWFLREELPPGARVGLHPSVSPSWATYWSCAGYDVAQVELPQGGAIDRDVVFVDLRFLAPDDVTDLLGAYDVRVMGSLAAVRRGEEFEAWSFETSEPTALEWMVSNGTEPVRTLVADPFATWELAFQFGFDAPPPDDEPVSLDQLRIAHNIARLHADEGRMQVLRAQLERSFVGQRIELSDGSAVLGVRIERGVAPRATILVEAGGALARGVELRLQSRVIERELGSITPVDPTYRLLSPPPIVPPRSWRRGFLYALQAPLLPRPGRERFDVSFTGPAAPRPIAGGAVVELFRD